MNNKTNNIENKSIQANDFVGRDNYTNIHLYNINSNMLSKDALEVIDRIIKKSDRVIKENFSDQILSMKGNIKTSFSTEKIFLSLGKIGIPIKVSIEIIENFLNKITESKEYIEVLTTNDIRKIIADSIYSMNESYYTIKEIENWGDKYVRRYGDPEQQLEIILNDDSTENLSLSFLRETLLEEVFERIDNNIKFTSAELVVSNTQKRIMAEEIKETILSLNLYRIHYHSLVVLVQELVTQPPHPWFIKQNSNNYILEYNYKKYLKHTQSILEVSINNKSSKGIKLHIEEYIYHACATILSYYNLHIGCGINAPLNNLMLYMKKLRDNEFDLLLKYSNIENIKNDLKKLGLTLEEFYQKLNNQIKKKPLSQHGNLSKEEVLSLWNNISFLHKFIVEVISRDIRDSSFKKVLNNNSLTDDEFDNTLLELINIFPFVKSSPVRKGSRSFYVVHDIKDGFISKLKPKIFITSINDNKMDNIEKLLKEIKNINLQFTDFIFVVSKIDCKLVLEKLEEQPIPIVNVTIYELLNAILENKEPLKGIERLLLSKIWFSSF